MIIVKSWSFKELVDNLKMLKQEYDFCLAFFSLQEEGTKERKEYRKKVRDMFYAIELKEWQIDIAWEYMNDYIIYPELIHILRIIDKRKKKWYN